MYNKFFTVLLSMFLIAAILPLKAYAQEWVSFNQSIIPEKPTAVVLKSDEFETIIKFTIPGMEVEDITEGTETFQSLRFPEYFTTLEIGKPQLPSISESIGIPNNSKVIVSVIDSTVITLEKKYRVYPFPEPVAGMRKYEFYINREFYETDLFYPEITAETGRPAIMRDIRNVFLRVYPIKYNPAKNEIKVYTDLTVKCLR